MEYLKQFIKKHAVLLLSVSGGILLFIIIYSFVFGRHYRDARFERGFGPQMGCDMGKGDFGRGGMKTACPMVQGKGMQNVLSPIEGPGMGGFIKEKIQAHVCQSGILQSGATEGLLFRIDMKINNLELIKKNMQSIAEYTSTELASGQIQALDDLIFRYNTQKEILKTDPNSFCLHHDEWATLNQDMKKFIMENVSGQMHLFKEKMKSKHFLKKGF